MADAASIERLITMFIAEELMGSRDAAVDPEDNLFTGGYVDSVGIMRLIGHLEATFAMKIPPTGSDPAELPDRARDGRLRRQTGQLSGWVAG